MDAESLERPALVVDGAGRWRLYLSCATAGTRHWRVEMLEASAPDAFMTASRRVVMPGDAHVGVKDPVIICDERGWRAWLCCHPLDDPDATDRMWTEFETSADGIDWTLHGPALQPTPGRWDQRERGSPRSSSEVMRWSRSTTAALLLQRDKGSAPASPRGDRTTSRPSATPRLHRRRNHTRRCAMRPWWTTAIGPPCTTRPAVRMRSQKPASQGQRLARLAATPVAVSDNEPVAFDEDLAGCIRELIGGEKALSEQRCSAASRLPDRRQHGDQRERRQGGLAGPRRSGQERHARPARPTSRSRS